MLDTKFRAWDVFYNKFVYSDKVGMVEFWKMVQGGISAGRDVPVQQFTGLLDKNGKEIYEGDIVTCVGGEDVPEGNTGECECLRTVEWSKEILSWVCSCKDCRSDISLYEFDLGEIIGNSYENPDLLK